MNPASKAADRPDSEQNVEVIGYCSAGPLYCRMLLVRSKETTPPETYGRLVASHFHPELGWICAELVAVLN